MPGLHGLLMAICLVLVIVAALHDIASRTIPNVLSFLLAGAGVALHLLDGSLLSGLAVAAGVFVLANLCWRCGWLGGGDVKLLAATTLAVPVPIVPDFLLATAIFGGVLALIYLLGRHRLPAVPAWQAARALPARVLRVEHWRIGRGGPLPYAVAIAAAGSFALLVGTTS